MDTDLETLNMTHMNISYQLSFNFKLCLRSLIGMFVATIFISSQAQADGVILIKSHPSQSPQFWRVFHFTKNEPSPYSYNVTLLNGQQQNFFRTEVGAILEEPKWSELIITSDAEWQKLEQQKTKLLDSLGQFPQLKNWSGSLAAKFDNLLDKNSPTTVIYRGSVISRDDYNKLRGLVSPSDSGNIEKGVMPELTIGSVKLTNVKLKSFNETRVSLVHTNGIQGYNLTDLKETEISSLSKAFPEFADHMKKLMAEDSHSPSISRMPSGIDKTQASSNSPKLATQASNMSDDSKLGVISKDYASLLGAKNVGSQVELPLTDEIYQSFVMIPAGSFTMGSPLDEEGRIKRGEDQVEVILSQPFWLAKTEVTQAQWEAVMGTNPSYFKGSNLPVENVNWMAVQAFIAKLNAKQILPPGWKFDLPTEAQWEYACRAGNKGRYCGRLDEVGWYDRNSGGMTHKVGQKKPNAWGLYDMHGNVWEWCANWYYETLKGETDPVGPSTASIRASRGGSWFFPAEDCRAAYRHGFEPDDLQDYLGFRPAIIRDDADINNLKAGQDDTSTWVQFEKQWLINDKKLTENTQQFLNVQNKLDKLNSISNMGEVSNTESVKLLLEMQRLSDEQAEILLVNDKLNEEARRIDPTGKKFKKLLESQQ